MRYSRSFISTLWSSRGITFIFPEQEWEWPGQGQSWEHKSVKYLSCMCENGAPTGSDSQQPCLAWIKSRTIDSLERKQTFRKAFTFGKRSLKCTAKSNCTRFVVCLSYSMSFQLCIQMTINGIVLVFNTLWPWQKWVIETDGKPKRKRKKITH